MADDSASSKGMSRGDARSGTKGRDARDRGNSKTDREYRDRMGLGNAAGLKAPGSIGLKDLNSATPGFGALGPRGPMAGWGTDPSFTGALKSYNDRSFMEKIADFLGGSFFDSVKPAPLNPKTYAGGIHHTGTNVPGSIATVLGAASGIPGLGTLLGLGASQLPGGTILHGGNPALEGYNQGTGMGAQPGRQGGTGVSVADRLQSILGRPTHSVTPPIAGPKPPAAAPSPSFTDYASKYLSVNAPGLQDYGIWTPFQRV